MEWISVKDRMPPYEKPLLVVDNNTVTTSMYHYRGGFVQKDYMHEPNVTHWMLLPDAPSRLIK